MRILCTEKTRIEVEPKVYSELDAHHEYYLDDKQARRLIADGRAYELDEGGRKVETRPVRAAKKAAASKPPAVKPSGVAGKPGGHRSAKAVAAAPENKAAQSDETAADQGDESGPAAGPDD